jgi:hypothetical protein
MPTLRCVPAKAEAPSQRWIAETTGEVRETMKGLSIVLLGLLHW